MSLLDSALNNLDSKMDADNAALSITIEENRLTALRHETPLSLKAWKDGASQWSYDENLNKLDITTGQARTVPGLIELPSKPTSIIFELLVSGATDALAIELRTQDITLNNDFPIIPDITIGSGVGAFRHLETMDTSGLTFPAAEGVIARIDFITTAGPNTTYEVFKIHLVY